MGAEIDNFYSLLTYWDSCKLAELLPIWLSLRQLHANDVSHFLHNVE